MVAVVPNLPYLACRHIHFPRDVVMSLASANYVIDRLRAARRMMMGCEPLLESGIGSEGLELSRLLAVFDPTFEL